jgi:hypothetical protein
MANLTYELKGKVGTILAISSIPTGTRLKNGYCNEQIT